MTSDSFERIWNERLFTYDASKPLQSQMPCTFAVLFQGWVDALFEGQLDGADLVRLNQLKLQVQDRFFEARSRLSSDHQDVDGRAPDHPCVFQVFERAIGLLHERQLALAPPPIVAGSGSSSGKAERLMRLDGFLVGNFDPEPEEEP